jgi:toxin secretion/phage lysis holin
MEPHPLYYFISPMTDPQAQVAVIALCALGLLDVLLGCVNAIFIQHDFSSHRFREGLIRKLSNLAMVVAADVIDAMLLGGLELGYQPVLLTITVSLALMELWSLLEIYAEMRPEISNSEWYQMLLRSKNGSTATRLSDTIEIDPTDELWSK